MSNHKRKTQTQNKPTKKTSTQKNIIFGIICLVLGLLVGFVGNIIFSLPSSYKIPKKTEVSTIAAGALDQNTIKGSDLSIHFLELGNKYTGDCILIVAGDTQILVDGGSKASSIPYIEKYVDQYFGAGDTTLDFVIVTHAHEDHYAGFATNQGTESLFDYYTKDEKSIGKIITFAKSNKYENPDKMFNNFKNNLATATAIIDNAEVYNAKQCCDNSGGAQKSYSIGNGARIEFLYQKYYDAVAKTENEYSVCFKIVDRDNKTYLFTGDLEKDGEKSLLDSNLGHGQVELYKAGHHGSKTSSSDYLISRIKPKITVVCCVAGSSEYTSKNENQFPTQEFVNNIFKNCNDPKIYVTSLSIDYSAGKFESFNGTIVVCAKSGQNTKVLCSNNTKSLQETDWFKANRTLPSAA